MTLPLFFLSILTTLEPFTALASTTSWRNDPDWARESGERPALQNEARRGSRRFAPKTPETEVSPFAPGSHNIALDIGQIFLMGEMASNYSNSIGARLHYTYGVSEMFGFDASGGYSNHSEGRFSLASLQAGLRVNIAWFDRVVPFAVAGMGFFRPSYDIPTENGIKNVAPIAFGLHVGPGVHLEVTKRLFFGASLQLQTLFNSRHLLSNNRLIDIGGSFTSFFVQAGFTL